MTTEEYYKSTATPSNLQGAVSKSMLWQFVQSPYKWFMGETFTGNAKTEFGQLVHALCFEPSKVTSQYVISKYDEFRTNEAKEWRREMETSGYNVVKAADMERARTIAETVMESEYIYSYGACDYEVQVHGMIGTTPIKGMIDIAPHSGANLSDLKVTGSIGTESDMARHIANMGYHWQGSAYLDMFNATNGTERTEFDLIFVEEDAPHEMAVFTLSENFLAKGREGYMNAVAKWQQCVATKQFLPAHPSKSVIEPPKYL